MRRNSKSIARTTIDSSRKFLVPTSEQMTLTDWSAKWREKLPD